MKTFCLTENKEVPNDSWKCYRNYHSMRLVYTKKELTQRAEEYKNLYLKAVATGQRGAEYVFKENMEKSLEKLEKGDYYE